MSGHSHRGGLGFGGAVGVGVALALLTTVIAIGHALARQLTEAASLVIVFAEIAVCAVLGGVTLAVLGLLAYRGQLARLHLAERRAEVARLEQAPSWRAEVLEADLPGSQDRPRAAILGELPGNLPSRRLEAVPEPDDRDSV